MEIIQQRQTATTTTRGVTLADRLRRLEKQKKLDERTVETQKKTKIFRWPFRWKMKFLKSSRIKDENLILVIFLNKKNEIEVPKFMPIFDGNMVVYKNKPYEFDPRAIWKIKGVRKHPMVYLIKETDRRPVRNKNGRALYVDAAVSNMDIDEIRKRGDSTESDEFLIKAALKAQTSTTKKKASAAMIIIAIIAVVGGIIWFLSSG